MTTKTPKWESELWSYLSKGNGERCPSYNCCGWRQRGGWCQHDDTRRLRRLLGCERFRPSSYDFIVCGVCGKIFELVEKLAHKYLEKGRVHCPPVPIELVYLVDEQSPVKIHMLPLKTCHGAMWRLKDGWVIQLKKDDPHATKRFVLFHEAFHILAHCNDAPVLAKRDVKLGSFYHKAGSFNELMADVFAAFVLMPGEWVREKWTETHDLEQMAQIFDVPKPQMCARLKFLGLI